jgi:hypothetical protein
MPEKQSNREKRKPPLAEKAGIYILRKSLGIYAWTQYGRDGLLVLEDSVLGLCEGAIIAPRLCYPSDEAGGELVLEQAHAGQLLGFDFRRPEYLPKAAELPSFSQEFEGASHVFMADEVKDTDPGELADVTYADFFTPDVLFSFDKASIEALIDAGMIFPKSHENAYEEAGAEQHIDGLRARGVADKLVYQIAKKAHTLITLLPDSGDPTPKKEKSPVLERLPGIPAH